MKEPMCESCMMPFAKDPGIRESDRYCSLCFKDGAFCYTGNSFSEFRRMAYQDMRERGMSSFKAFIFSWMARFAPRWRHTR